MRKLYNRHGLILSWDVWLMKIWQSINDYKWHQRKNKVNSEWFNMWNTRDEKLNDEETMVRGAINLIHCK